MEFSFSLLFFKKKMDNWSISIVEFHKPNMKWPSALFHLERKNNKWYYEFLYSNLFKSEEEK